MINIDLWIKDFLRALDGTFGDRVGFVGLQGSYGRGEASEDSDLDMVVILDQLTADDLVQYRRMLSTLPHREKQCGFLSGWGELMDWDPSDLFQLYYDTVPISGSLDAVRPLLTTDTVKRAIKMGACNIYHGGVHNMLYGHSDRTLLGLYKAATFVCQAICYQQTGVYHRSRGELVKNLSTDEREIVDTFSSLKNGCDMDFDALSFRIFSWAGKWIHI